MVKGYISKYRNWLGIKWLLFILLKMIKNDIIIQKVQKEVVGFGEWI